ncbi:MAG: N-methyl-L-tryptophan oxidase [Planctomycetes bacterium]|nr:N-methyl-L-tryptophan oxidase [Planctomycetota bacterium]
MSEWDCDVAVVGVGGAGSAALYHAAKRGARAIGVDPNPPGHDRGSSHGDTRIIRLAYMEAPGYVPLLRRAFELWGALERESGRRLYTQTGLLQIGPADCHVLAGARRSAEEHGLELEQLDAAEVGRRFPPFRMQPGERAVFDPRAGFLAVEDGVRTHVAEAQRLGAELRQVGAVRWEVAGEGARVHLTDGTALRARRLILAPGGWAPTLLADLELPLTLLRKVLVWVPCADDAYLAERFPVFLCDSGAGVFYGFPRRGADPELKLAEHSGGAALAHPEALERGLLPGDAEPVLAYLARSLPGLERRVLRHAVCFYTQTPDEHFVLGAHPRHPQVALVAGLSGHGYKFAPVLGEVLAELALDGATRHEVGFLSPTRFA